MQRWQLMISHLIWKVLCCDFIGILRWDLHSKITLIAVCLAVSVHDSTRFSHGELTSMFLFGCVGLGTYTSSAESSADNVCCRVIELFSTAESQ